MQKDLEINVIIVALVGGEALESCIQSLISIRERCVVVLGGDMGNTSMWERHYPKVKFLEGEHLPVPLKRRLGIDAVEGDVVALLEDTSVPDKGWLNSIRLAFEDNRITAVGGPVLISPSLPMKFKALACGEYGRFHPHRFALLATAKETIRGLMVVSRLPGNNLAYRRGDLMKVLDQSDKGLIEGEVNDILLKSGHHLAFHPDMKVIYSVADEYGASLKTRVQHGRIYGSNRVKGCGRIVRFVCFIKSFILPAVLSGRAIINMKYAIKPSSWLSVLFWICLMESAWACGEAMGYLMGEGRSIEAWR